MSKGLGSIGSRIDLASGAGASAALASCSSVP